MGQPSETLPLELPFPEQSRVITSVRSGENDYVLLIEVHNPFVNARSWYSSRLRTLGWYPWKADENHSGRRPFLDSRFCHSQGHNRLEFYYLQPFSTLTLTFSELSATTTLIKSELIFSGGFSNLIQDDLGTDLSYFPPLPELVPSPNTSVKLQTSGGSDKDWQSEAIVQIQTDSFVVLEDYNKQLIQLGWIQVSGQGREPLLWSIWHLTDHKNQEWQLVLSLALHETQSTLYLAHLWLTEINYFDEFISIPSEKPKDTINSVPEDIFWRLYSSNLSSFAENEQLWSGECPAEISIGLCFPEQAQLLGSFINPEYDQITLYLNASIPHDELHQELAAQLTELGWIEWDPFRYLTERGFEASQKGTLIETRFFHPESQLQAGISAYQISRNRTDLRVSWTLSSNVDSVHRYENINEDKQVSALLLNLSCPEKTKIVQKRVSGKISGEITSIVHIKTSLPFASLCSHYQGELQQTGWQLKGVDKDESYYLSLWFYADQQRQLWQAHLYILKRDNKRDQYIGFLKLKIIG
ncbi:MAG: hypothetical protein F6J95_025765 [Leptolyngbya sp. SIO1E4]|nr:hypothetical protein [Leptolyngbya sp. SIO1E4]